MANVVGVFYVLVGGVFMALIFAFIAVLCETRRVCKENEVRLHRKWFSCDLEFSIQCIFDENIQPIPAFILLPFRRDPNNIIFLFYH